MHVIKAAERAAVFAATVVALYAAAPDALAGQGAGAREACITPKCHAGMLGPRFVHGPVAVQDCVLCHRQTGKHGFTLAAKGAELCYLCHERMKPGHGTACVSCHDPHGSDREFQLKPGVKKK